MEPTVERNAGNRRNRPGSNRGNRGNLDGGDGVGEFDRVFGDNRGE